MKKILISGVIGLDISANSIKGQLTAARGEDVSVDISSPGGLVFPSIDIFNAFRDYKRSYPGMRMESNIKSLAASGASYIAVNPVFDKVSIEDNGALMIHNSQGMVQGDRREMQKYFTTLEKIDGILAQAYAARSGKSIKAIREIMDNESWYFGPEAVDAGFVGDVIKTGNPVDRQTALLTAKAHFAEISGRVKMDLAACAVEFEKIGGIYAPPADGVIRSEKDYFAELNRVRVADGQNPLEPIEDCPGAPDGQIVTEADFQAELRRSRRLDGMS